MKDGPDSIPLCRFEELVSPRKLAKGGARLSGGCVAEAVPRCQ